jgi:hypothetical protein
MKAKALWKCMALEYSGMQSGYKAATGIITSISFTAGRFGSRNITDKTVLLGEAVIFNKTNIDRFN